MNVHDNLDFCESCKEYVNTFRCPGATDGIISKKRSIRRKSKAPYFTKFLTLTIFIWICQHYHTSTFSKSMDKKNDIEGISDFRYNRIVTEIENLESKKKKMDKSGNRENTILKRKTDYKDDYKSEKKEEGENTDIEGVEAECVKAENARKENTETQNIESGNVEEGSKVREKKSETENVGIKKLLSKYKNRYKSAFSGMKRMLLGYKDSYESEMEGLKKDMASSMELVNNKSEISQMGSTYSESKDLGNVPFGVEKENIKAESAEKKNVEAEHVRVKRVERNNKELQGKLTEIAEVQRIETENVKIENADSERSYLGGIGIGNVLLNNKKRRKSSESPFSSIKKLLSDYKSSYKSHSAGLKKMASPSKESVNKEPNNHNCYSEIAKLDKKDNSKSERIRIKKMFSKYKRSCKSQYKGVRKKLSHYKDNYESHIPGLRKKRIRKKYCGKGHPESGEDIDSDESDSNDSDSSESDSDESDSSDSDSSESNNDDSDNDKSDEDKPYKDKLDRDKSHNNVCEKELKKKDIITKKL
ncbi:Plasmodium exported protein, unknown function [Plasmodium ovale curtisi]|uniref:Uncharacterized protein n=1 Tax=Plasmodium ovale curtisi TaxID=864141 RepID=A0A1A8VPT5_PLAOA|nr:Plasmodium exported protein, unknown function [Plasmodium ovale curtisi]